MLPELIGKNIILIVSALLSLMMIVMFRRIKKNSLKHSGASGGFKSAMNLPYRQFKAEIRGHFGAPTLFLLLLLLLFAAVSFAFILYRFNIAAAVLLCIPCAAACSFVFSEIIWLLAYLIRKVIALENARMNAIFSIIVVILAMVFTGIATAGTVHTVQFFWLSVYNLAFCYLATVATLLLLLKEAGDGQRRLTLRNLWKSTFLIIILFLVILSALSYVGGLYDAGAFAGGARYSYFDMFYYTCVTFATVGFGDIVPANIFTKSVCILTIATSIICITILLSTVLSVRANEKKKE